MHYSKNTNPVKDTPKVTVIFNPPLSGRVATLI